MVQYAGFCMKKDFLFRAESILFHEKPNEVVLGIVHEKSLTQLTGKSFSEARILASTNPQYDNRLFIDLPVQYMKTTSSEHVCINCFLFLF